ncbi:hypothetical protein EYF80_051973 [Liparis tanakae]|uniref:Uncharacterized protein n=1 Tax=Liparis tanakae TaxID=230148 RepID=A0A4Z2F9I9_9TELE|nr:hypothetical protein EYF80_051973 [Liparis tanakae]
MEDLVSVKIMIHSSASCVVEAKTRVASDRVIDVDEARLLTAQHRQAGVDHLDGGVEASGFQQVALEHTGDAEAVIPPEAAFLGENKLVVPRGLLGVHHLGVVLTEDHREIDLSPLDGVGSAALQSLAAEDEIHIAEEEQRVVVELRGAQLQSQPPGEVAHHGDHGQVGFGIPPAVVSEQPAVLSSVRVAAAVHQDDGELDVLSGYQTHLLEVLHEADEGVVATG